ncbi:hypothetical protein PVK06_042808 [Gossypium arboreum]|uniref:Uncharacterized protein n=1 Tax=Gossypium arboreum TaxID=29729 RepID=A0ABR0MM80_GOSAR|nr:hypothetical protein PVK06_042808 [Gossypium arboreum]
MDWFKHHGMSYLLPTSERSRQCRRKRPRRGPINPRSGGHAADGLTSTPPAYEDQIVIQPPGQYGLFIPITNPFYFTLLSQYVLVYFTPSP